jgi:eukaryotic-like serine/threonine-protein kinase
MRLNRAVALKLLLGGAGRSSAAAARLLREARAVASFNHPNAVTIFDVGELDGSPYIAMELVVGRTLSAFVRDEGAPWIAKLRWLADAARALGASHRAGLVHRDVKPDNVMVRDDGFVKVVDFGIARRVPVAAARCPPRARPLEGTPCYMAPEQIAGDAADAQVDQFAWGVMAYEVLSGALPWPTEAGFPKLVEAILMATPTPLPARVLDLPAGVDRCIRRALEKNPRRRYPSMSELVADIEPHAAPSWSALPPGRAREWCAERLHTEPADLPPPEATNPERESHGRAQRTRPSIGEKAALP